MLANAVFDTKVIISSGIKAHQERQVLFMAGDATNRKYDSHGNLIEWTDGHGWTHVDTKRIAKDFAEARSAVDRDLNNSSSSSSSYSGYCMSDAAAGAWLIFAIAAAVALFVFILIIASLFFNWLGVLVIGIIMAGLFVGSMLILWKCYQ